VIPKISLVKEGLFDPAKLTAFTREKQKKIYTGTARAMSAFGTETDARIRTDVARSFKVRRRNFVTSFKHKVFSAKTERMPSMVIGSKVPFAGIFEKGGTIRGRMLIPMNMDRRIGYVKFRSIVRALIASGNAFFKNVNGRVILFAENIRENARQLAPWRRSMRRTTGARLKRGQEIPIAVLVQSVTIKKRLHVEDTVRRGLPRLARLMELEIGKP
jgi:hypothetical protein